MEASKIPAPRSSSDWGSADPFDEYHRIVSAVFADHRPNTDLHDPAHAAYDAGHAERCSCGAPWPCTDERLAAQLLDWGV